MAIDQISVAHKTFDCWVYQNFLVLISKRIPVEGWPRINKNLNFRWKMTWVVVSVNLFLTNIDLSFFCFLIRHETFLLSFAGTKCLSFVMKKCIEYLMNKKMNHDKKGNEQQIRQGTVLHDSTQNMSWHLSQEKGLLYDDFLMINITWKSSSWGWNNFPCNSNCYITDRFHFRQEIKRLMNEIW